ncbi:ABC transporter substrate-binding protein [Pelagibius sp.]|uniref:ABC transporter substrate-binding protein n=1 Tax=Pelagibius sp. TaxID=1931238 RepID=UPI003BAF49C4
MTRDQSRFGHAVAMVILAMAPTAASAEDLIVAAVSGPRGVDGDVWKPGSIETVVNVYESLVRYGYRAENGTQVIDSSVIEPHLAESWTESEDGTEYVFTLRQGVKSYYGNELTADDIVFGWEKSKSQGRTGNFISTASRIETVEALSPYKVKYTLIQPNNLFLRALSHYTPMLIDSTEAKKHATPDDPYATKWFDSNTAGFGAYHLMNNRAGEGAIFIANPNYFGEKPYFDRVIYREIPSAATRTSLLIAGEVHIAEQLNQQQLAMVHATEGTKVMSHPGSGSATVRMNPHIPPFDDLRLRRAILYAVDYEAIDQAVFGGVGERSQSILPPSVPGYIKALYYVHDAERAKELLTEAGYPDGIDIDLHYTSVFWWEEPLVLQLRSQLAEVGIRVTPVKLPNTEFSARGAIGRRDLPFATHLTNVFVLDPGYALFLSAHSKGSSNRNDYSFPEFDALIETAIVERDQKKAMEAVAEAQRRHAEDATWIDTFFPGTHVAMRACVKNWVWYPTNRLVWRQLSCEK